MLEVLTNKSLFSKLKAKVHSKESIYRLIMCFSFILIDEHELPGLSNLTVSVAEIGRHTCAVYSQHETAR